MQSHRQSSGDAVPSFPRFRPLITHMPVIAGAATGACLIVTVADSEGATSKTRRRALSPASYLVPPVPWLRQQKMRGARQRAVTMSNLINCRDRRISALSHAFRYFPLRRDSQRLPSDLACYGFG